MRDSQKPGETEETGTVENGQQVIILAKNTPENGLTARKRKLFIALH